MAYASSLPLGMGQIEFDLAIKLHVHVRMCSTDEFTNAYHIHKNMLGRDKNHARSFTKIAKAANLQAAAAAVAAFLLSE